MPQALVVGPGLTPKPPSPLALAKLQKRHQFCTGVLHGKCSDFSRPWFWNEIVDFRTLGEQS
jgi:hypothetical protein